MKLNRTLCCKREVMPIFNASKLPKNRRQPRVKENQDSQEKYTILVVDDEEAITDIISTLLKRYYHVLTAQDGQEALDLLESLDAPEKIVVILSDQRMPRLTGAQFLRKTIPIVPQTKRVIMTGYTDINAIIDAVNQGEISHFLTKPFDKHALLESIRLMISKYEVEKKNRLLTQELRSLNKSLENKVQKRTQALSEANEALLDKEKALIKLNANKDRFFRIISHDLRAPFNGLIGIPEILFKDIDNLSRKEISDFAKTLYPKTKGLFSLLENLLKWATIQMEGLTWNPQTVDLHEFISENIDVLGAHADTKRIQLFNEVAKESFVYADLDMLHSIIRNLLSNALKFTQLGGKVSISTSQNREGFLQIKVEDNGIGISEKNINILFKIEENTTRKGTEEEEGSGIGLILCKELIEKNQGEIWVESKVGKGSHFYFTLPLPPFKTEDLSNRKEDSSNRKEDSSNLTEGLLRTKRSSKVENLRNARK